MRARINFLALIHSLNLDVSHIYLVEQNFVFSFLLKSTNFNTTLYG